MLFRSSRRTRIAFESADQGLGIVTTVAEIIAPVLGWNEIEKRSSIDDYREKVQRQNDLLESAVKGESKVS